MAGLAGACNSVSGNLVAVEDGHLQALWANGLDPAMWDDLGETMNNEKLNPRLFLGGKAAAFKRVEGVNFASDEWTRRFPVYGEVCRKYDLGFGILMNLKTTSRDYIGVGVLRNEKQGHGADADGEALMALASHLRDAVTLRRMVEDQGALVACGAMDAIGSAAFLCDAWGRVRKLTPSAEALVECGAPLVLKAGMLSCRSIESARALTTAIGLAARDPMTPIQTLVLKQEGADPLILDIAALPPLLGAVGFAPRAIVTVRRPRLPSASAILMTMFGLTQAEADVARALAQGDARETIAQARGVSLGTIRTQLKGIFAKLGVSREAELIARIYQFSG